MKYMIDTCIFNHILDKHYSLSDLPEGEYSITHIQRDELLSTQDIARRDSLLTQLTTVNPKVDATTVFVLGKSRLGQARIGEGKSYQIILEKLNKRKKKKSNGNDAIIGDTCINLNYNLLTGDKYFKEVMEEIWNKDQVIYWEK